MSFFASDTRLSLSVKQGRRPHSQNLGRNRVGLRRLRVTVLEPPYSNLRVLILLASEAVEKVIRVRHANQASTIVSLASHRLVVKDCLSRSTVCYPCSLCSLLSQLPISRPSRSSSSRTNSFGERSSVLPYTTRLLGADAPLLDEVP